MAVTLTVDFPVTGKTLEELEANAAAAAKRLAGDREHTLEVRHVHGTYLPLEGRKGDPATPSSFTAQVTATVTAPPDGFAGDEHQDRADTAW